MARDLDRRLWDVLVEEFEDVLPRQLFDGNAAASPLPFSKGREVLF
jgi:hypothetical protein